MNRSDTIWMRITALARHAPEAPAGLPPPGFSTRIVARAFAARGRTDEFLVRYALRALGLAGALAVVCLLGNLGLVTNDMSAEADINDPVGEFITGL